jgi:hypothetical protein
VESLIIFSIATSNSARGFPPFWKSLGVSGLLYHCNFLIGTFTYLNR